MSEIDIIHCSRGPTLFSGGGDPTLAAVVRRLRVPQRLRAVARLRCRLEDSFLARAAGAPQRGIAVIVAMMGILIISALGTALVLGTTTETLIARNFRITTAGSYAADLALQFAIDDL